MFVYRRMWNVKTTIQHFEIFLLQMNRMDIFPLLLLAILMLQTKWILKHVQKTSAQKTSAFYVCTCQLFFVVAQSWSWFLDGIWSLIWLPPLGLLHNVYTWKQNRAQNPLFLFSFFNFFPLEWIKTEFPLRNCCFYSLKIEVIWLYSTKVPRTLFYFYPHMLERKGENKQTNKQTNKHTPTYNTLQKKMNRLQITGAQVPHC